jgi:hypothetical protein
LAVLVMVFPAEETSRPAPANVAQPCNVRDAIAISSVVVRRGLAAIWGILGVATGLPVAQGTIMPRFPKRGANLRQHGVDGVPNPPLARLIICGA